MRKTLSMLLVALLLAGYVYFYEIKGGEERAAIKQKAEKLISLKKDSVNVLDISGATGHFHFVKQDDGGWMLESPIATIADKNKVLSYITTLTTAKKTRTLTADKKDLGQYGLQNPFFNIRLQAGSRKDSIRIGDNTSIGSSVFAGKGDSLVFMTQATVKSNARKSLFDWREQRIVLFNKAKVKEIRLKTPKGYFVLERKGDWYLKKPIQTEADQTAVTEVLNKLNYGKMKKVETEQAEDLHKFHLNHPAYRISVFENGTKEANVILSAPVGDKVFGKDNVRPLVFSLDKAYVKTLDKTLFDLRDKRFNKAAVTGADKVEWHLKGKKTDVAQKNTGKLWILNGTDTLETFKMNGLLNGIRALKATSFIPEKKSALKRYGLNKSPDSIILYKAGKVIDRLDFGRTEKDKRYIHAGGQVVTVATTALKNILKPADSYKKQKKVHAVTKK